MPEVRTNNSFKVTITGEQREGFCEDCGTQTVKEFYMDGERKRVHMICPKCGGQGRLIVRTYSIHAPKSPQCVRFKCLWKFFLGVLFCSLLSTYHDKRVEYATHNKHKNIPDKYRTGEPSPQTIRQAIKFIIKLEIYKFRR